MERQYSTFHGTPNRDYNRTDQWNSSGPGFHLIIDAVFYSCISSFISQCFFWERCCRSLHLLIFPVTLLHSQDFCLCYQVTLDLSQSLHYITIWIKPIVRLPKCLKTNQWPRTLKTVRVSKKNNFIDHVKEEFTKGK